MIYICIDTNVYIQMLSEIVDDNEVNNPDVPTQLDDLDILCRENIVQLLVPEVVKLELEKFNKKAEEDYKENYSKLIDIVDKTVLGLWNGIRDIRNKVITDIESEQDLKIQNWKREYEKLKSFFSAEYVENIELTSEILCDGFRKKISGDITESQFNDALILESVYSYLEHSDWQNDDQIFLVTGDKKDFFKKGEKDCIKELRTKFIRQNYKVQGVYNIKQLYKYINANYEIELPKQYIQTCWQEFEKKYPDWDIDNDIAQKEHFQIQEQIDYKINKIFEDKTQNLPEYISKIRKRILNEIEVILNECRDKLSWSDRSESKLYLWLHNRQEIKIYSSKISDLLIIRDNLKQYLKIHEDMDREILDERDYEICKQCHKYFIYKVNDMNISGGKEKEDILCPYCNAKNGSIMTDGLVNSFKIEDVLDTEL